MTATRDLLARIERREANLAVIGIGYVGLPVAAQFAATGFEVLGVDLKADTVQRVNAGECVIGGEEPGLAELVERVVRVGKLRATTEYADLSQSDVVIIAVETPVDASHKPRYEALRAACRSLGQVLKPGSLVIVESTIAPGTMRDLVIPILEEASGKRVNRHFFLVACPERVMPGRLLSNLASMSRVVGGSSDQAAELGAALYRHIVKADLDVTDLLTAEIVKTAENAYRDVQIAFANELALLCESLGADVWAVRRLVNKSPGRQMHLPGAGVGGHCIPKDPWLLIANAGEGFQARVIPAARSVNDDMPLHMADLVQRALRAEGVDPASARVAVLGFAYLENSDDARNSPSAVLVTCLQEAVLEVRVHDPYVPGYERDWEKVVRGCDAVVVMVGHDVYRSIELPKLRRLMRHPLLVDGRNVFRKEQVEQAGLHHFVVGVGKSPV